MGSLEKLSEDVELAEEKRDTRQRAMSLVMLEWENAEAHFKTIQEFFRGCFSELECKEKHLKVVQESIRERCEEFDSRRKWAEEGLKKLDVKEEFLKGVLREIEVEKMEFEKMSGLVEEKLKDVASKEQRFQAVFEELILIQSGVEKRGNELDLKEKNLEGRGIEIGSKEKRLEIREREVDSKEKILEGRGIEIDSKEKTLEIREREVDSKDRILERREKVIASEEQRLEKWANGLEMKQKMYEDLVKEFQLKQGILQLQSEIVSLSKAPQQNVQEPHSLTPCSTDSRKRCRNSGSVFNGISDAVVEGIITEGTSTNRGKRSCIQGKSSAQTKAQNPGKSGSGYKPQPADIMVLDDPQSDSISRDNLGSNQISLSTHIEKDKMVRKFNVGETWACIDANDNMPRSYARVIMVLNEGAKVRLGVNWLKPSPNPKLLAFLMFLLRWKVGWKIGKKLKKKKKKYT